MLKNLTHIDFPKGCEIKPSFAKAIGASAEQRRDPSAIKEGYWLVNISEERVRQQAEKYNQSISRIRSDCHFPKV